MMGCVIPLGVFALSVRSGWQTEAIVGVQLRRQGAVFLSKNFQGFVLAGNVPLFDFLPSNEKERREEEGNPSGYIQFLKMDCRICLFFPCYAV